MDNKIYAGLRFPKGVKKVLSLLLATAMLLTSVDLTGLGVITSHAAEKRTVFTPEIEWSRSIEIGDYRQVLENSSVWMNWKPENKPKWKWSDVKDIGLGLTDENQIWDGNTDEPYMSKYASNVRSATWTGRGLRRFQGKFKIPEGYTTNDFIRLKSSNQDAYTSINRGNILPINDDIFIFVYKENEQITNDNFMNFLAFWTGVDNQNGLQDFHGVVGTQVKRYIPLNEKPQESFYVQNEVNYKKGLISSDGWAAEANLDNIGSTLFKNYPAENGDFIIDIFTYDTSDGEDGGGGMDELMLEFAENTKYSVIVRYWKDTVNGMLLNSETMTDLKLQDNIVLDQQALNKYKPDGYLNGVQQNAPYIVIDHKGHIDVVYKSATKIQVIKQWDDDSNQDGLRPKKVTVQLYANENAVEEPVELNAENDWNKEWKGLPNDDNDGKIRYTVKELSTENKPLDNNSRYNDSYTVTYNHENNQTIITNTHKPEVTEKIVEKIWKDGNNQDGKRQNVKVQLMAGTLAKGNPVELKEENNWSAKWENLPAYSGGQKILYTVKEITEIPGYETAYSPIDRAFDKDGHITITNSHTPETISVPIVKRWKDGDQEEERPDEISVQLYSQIEDGQKNEVEEPFTIKKANDWKISIDNLPKYKDGKEIIYSVEETTKTVGYEATPVYTTETIDGVPTLVITNKINQETISIAGEKKWVDGGEINKRKPVKVQLIVDGEVAVDVDGEEAITVDENSGWKYEFDNLPKYDDDGNLIPYKVKELTEVEGYTSKTDGNNLINTRKDIDEKVDIKVKKTWLDGGENQLRPDSIRIELLQNGVSMNPQRIEVMEKSNNWKEITFTDIPKFDGGGKPYEYTVQELDLKTPAFDKYGDPKIEASAAEPYKFTITNVRKDIDDTITLSVEKQWIDGNDMKIRPEKITIQIRQDDEKDPIYTAQMVKGENDTDNTWNLTIDREFPKYNPHTGKEYRYTVSEGNEIEHYRTGTITQPDKDNGYKATIKNIRADIDDTVSFDLEKKWIDGGDPEGRLRPDSITFELLRDGKSITPKVTNEMRKSDDWAKINFSEQPRYNKETGEEYKYSIEEKISESGIAATYTSDISSTFVDKRYSFICTNTRKDIRETVDITADKKWVDGGDPDGSLRPRTLTFELLQNEKPMEPVVTKSMTADSNWAQIHFENQPKFDLNTGAQYQYSVVEKGADSSKYDASYEVDKENPYHFHFTNTRKDIADQIEIQVKKEWIDGGDPEDTLRPKTLTFKLFRDGNEEPLSTEEMKKEDGWNDISFGKFPKYNPETGDLYQYTVEETGELDKYKSHKPISSPSIENGKYIYSFTNTIAVIGQTTNITVEKEWVDGDDVTKRPDNISITLKRKVQDNAEKIVDTKEVTPATNWEVIFEKQPLVDEHGAPYTYLVLEDSVTGYRVRSIEQPVSANDYTATITNEINDIAQEISVKAIKHWVDGNTESLRPEAVTFQLYQNGKPLQNREQKVSPDSTGNWETVFTKLPKYDITTGKLYEYEVKEKAVENYILDEKNTILPTKNNNYTAELTNKRADINAKLNITVNKTWIDGDNVAARPDSVSFTLYRNEQQYGTVKTSFKNEDWNPVSFTDLPKFDSGGKEYTYMVGESKVDGYRSSISKETVENSDNIVFSVVNRRDDIEALIDVTVEKKWIDGDDALQRPALNFKLSSDNVLLESNKARKVDENKWVFEDLPKFNVETGKPIAYSVEEEFEGNYDQISYMPPTDKNSYTASFTNKRRDMDDTAEIEVTKIWKDGGDNDRRPSEITFYLYQNGDDKPMTTVSPITLTKEDGWQNKFFSSVPKRDEGGHYYDYTVKEGTVKGYEYLEDQSIQPSEDNGYRATITNRRDNINEPVDITVTKEWIDGGEEDRRPESIIFTLNQNGIEYVTSDPVTKENGWNVVFRQVPKYDDDGNLYQYTISENSVDGYDTNVTQQPSEENGYNAIVKNTRDDIGEQISINIEKTWKDGNDTANRPAQITFRLKQNDNAIEETATMTADGDWKTSFENLPKYDPISGALFEYEVIEDTPANYTQEFTQQPSEDNGYWAKVVNTRSDIYRTVPITVKKQWIDGGQKDLRPGSITFGLLRNGKPANIPTQTMTGENDWSIQFQDLPMYDDDGRAYEYTVEEGAVAGYALRSISQPTKDNGYQSVVTNVREDIKKKIKVTVKKEWADDNNQSNRPEEIVFELKQNGNSFNPAKTRTMKQVENWEPISFDGLDKCDEDGSEIVYSITEQEIPNYGYSVIQEPTAQNRYQAIIRNSRDDIGTIIEKITVEKVWNDGEDFQNLRPDHITFELLRNGKPMEPRVTAAMNKSDGWKEVSFNDGYPKFDKESGAPYSYTIVEESIEDYGTPTIVQPTSENGYHAVVTNSPYNMDEEITITVDKSWIDSGSGRPDKVVFNLLKNRNPVDTKTMTVAADGSWPSITFENLEKFDEKGFENLYEITEVTPDHYKATIVQPTEENAYHAEVTNSRSDLDETVNITVNKIWVDGNNKSLRPDNVTFRLTRNGDVVAADEMTAANGWKLTFENQPKCNATGDTYEYRIEEVPVPGYVMSDIIQPDESSRYQASVTNTYQTATVELTAQKKLTDDTTNQPLSMESGLFTFKLMKGDEVIQTVRNDADGTIEFAPLTFSYKDEGTTTYKIVESKELDDAIDPEGYRFDETVYYVHVNVEVNEDNTLAVSEIYDRDGEGIDKENIVFENTYETPVNDLIIRKQLIGASDETFQFTLTLNGYLYTGKYSIGNEEFDAENGILYIPGNKQAIVKGIPKGTEYTITETDSKGHAVIANGEAVNSITGTMRSKKENAPVVEFINIPKDRLAISKTRIGGSEKDIFTFSLRYSKANASDATPADSDVGTPSNQKSSSKRNNYKTLLDDVFGSNDNSLYLFKGDYDLYTHNSDGGLAHQGKKTAEDGKIKLKGGEVAVINNFVLDTEYEVTEVLPDDSSYRLAEASVDNPFTGTIAAATDSNADIAVMAYDLSDDFTNLANFVNVFKYSEIRTRYHIYNIDKDGNREDRIQGNIPDSGYDRFEVDKDLSKLGTEYFNEIFKTNGKENIYDLASVTVIKETANNSEEIVYSSIGGNIGNALEDFDIAGLDQDAVYKITADFIQVRGTVILNKTGLNGAGLEGAKFQLYNSDNQPIGSVLTTDSEGRIIRENLLPGQYYFLETAAPAGYVRNSEPQEFELTAENGYMAVAEISMENHPDTGSVILEKVDGSGNGLKGVTFSLYHADGEKINTEELVTDVNGEIKVDGLELGSYYFTEEEALEGYVKDSAEIHFNITFEDIASKTPVKPAPFVNRYEEDGVIELTKTDRDNNPLSGAVFDLYKVGNAVPLRSNLVTDADGKIIVTDLPIGQYYFVETKAPEGYVTPEGNNARSSTMEINFAENIRDNQIKEITIINDIQTGSVKLTKTNVSESISLKGAEFNLYREDGTLVKAGLVTDANGFITYENLPVGEYYFEETKAPSGYRMPKGDDAFTYFTVKYNVQTDVLVTNVSSGRSSGGGNGSGGGRTPGDTAGEPGTTIPDNPVPLANMPTAGTSGDSGIVINDGMVPLAALPKTGDSPFKGLMTLFTGLLLGLAALFGKKKKEDEQ